MSEKQTNQTIPNQVTSEDLFKSLKEISYDEMKTWSKLQAVLEKRTNKERGYSSYRINLYLATKLVLTTVLKEEEYFLMQLRFNIPDQQDKKIFPIRQ